MRLGLGLSVCPMSIVWNLGRLSNEYYIELDLGLGVCSVHCIVLLFHIPMQELRLGVHVHVHVDYYYLKPTFNSVYEKV